MLAFLAFKQVIPPHLQWLGVVLGVLPVYAAYAVSHAYLQARTGNLAWNNTVAPGVRFSSSLSATALTKLYIGNILAAAFTAGLLIPWAVVRTLRYRLDNLALIVSADSPYQANPALAPVGATSQELGDFFNLDVSL